MPMKTLKAGDKASWQLGINNFKNKDILKIFLKIVQRFFSPITLTLSFHFSTEVGKKIYTLQETQVWCHILKP